MTPTQVKSFWKIYKSSIFKKELQRELSKIESLKEIQDLSQKYTIKEVALIINRSTSFVNKSLKVFRDYERSRQITRISKRMFVCKLIIRVPKYEQLFKLVKSSKIKVDTLLKLRRFWDLSLKGCGSKKIAFLYYCLKRTGIVIEKAKWCKR